MKDLNTVMKRKGKIMDNKFNQYISDLLAQETNLIHEWRNENTEIIFKKKAADGFDVVIGYYDTNSIYLETNTGCHDQYDASDDFEELMINVMGLVRDMLSKRMRIVEILTNNKPRKWILQFFVNDRWLTENTIGVIFWNFLGRKTEKIYSNDILAERNS